MLFCRDWAKPPWLPVAVHRVVTSRGVALSWMVSGSLQSKGAAPPALWETAQQSSEGRVTSRRSTEMTVLGFDSDPVIT